MDVFSVQRVSEDKSVAFERCITVEALCPVKAGEIVLSEPLTLYGKILRAKIWFLKDDYTPQSVDLYATEGS